MSNKSFRFVRYAVVSNAVAGNVTCAEGEEWITASLLIKLLWMTVTNKKRLEIYYFLLCVFSAEQIHSEIATRVSLLTFYGTLNERNNLPLVVAFLLFVCRLSFAKLEVMCKEQWALRDP